MSRRAIIAVGEPLDGQGGLARIADQQKRVLQELGWEVAAATPTGITPWRSRKFPALNNFLLSCQVSALARSMSGRDGILFSHGMCGARGSRGRQMHLHHGTCAGLADACRARMSRAEYFIVRRLNGMLERRSGRRATNLAVSANVVDEARRYYGIPGVGVLHNAVDTDHFAPGLPPGQTEAFTGLVVGRVDYGKGRDTIRMLGRLLEPRYRIALASAHVQGEAGWGDGRTCYLGYVAYPGMPPAYRDADYLLCASRYEGFGLTLIEAWACGKPVVATSVGIIRELRGMEPTLDRLVVDDPDDADAFAERIRFLRGHPEIGARQAIWGREMVVERFSLQRYRAEWRRRLEAFA